MEIRPQQFGGIRVSLAISFGCLVTVLLFITVTPSAAQQLSQQWVNRVDGPAQGSTLSYAVAADANDNSYVTGTVCQPPGDPNPDLTCPQAELQVVKYDKAGNTVWTETLNTPGNQAVGTSVKVDLGGNVYVAGFGTTGQTITDPSVGPAPTPTVEFVLAKYNSSGQGQWVEYYNPPGGSATDDDEALEVNHLPLLVIDSQGNSYISVYDEKDDLGPTWTVKYDPSGNQLWATEFPSATTSIQGISQSTPSGLAIDTQGNVHITGTIDFYAGLQQAFTLEYDPNGNQLWAQTFDSQGFNGTFSSGIAVDLSGNSYVGVWGGGYYNLQIALPQAAYVIKYSPSGQQLWASKYITPGLYGNYVTGIAVDTMGNSYATGAVATVPLPTDTSPGQWSGDFDTLKFDTNGNFVWEQRYPGNQNVPSHPFFSRPISYELGASAIALDSNDNVYVTGQSTSSGNANGLDYATVEYDSNGNQLGAATYNGPGNGDDVPVGIAVGSSDMFVTGYSEGSDTNYDWASVAYGQAGPSINISPSSIVFSSETVGATSSAQTVTVTNNGDAALNITAAPAISGTNAGDFGIASGTTCTNGASIPGSGSCVIDITFSPSTTGSEGPATLTIADSDSSSPQTIALSGTGTAAPVSAVSFAPNGLTFASQPEGTTSGAQSVTLTNTGNASLSISSVTISGSNASEFAKTNVTCEASLAAGASCTISVDFTPSATGTQTAMISVADNAPSSPQTVALTGTGNAAAAPAVGLAPSSLTFAAQVVSTTSAAQMVTLTNTGNATLTISGITVAGSDAKEFPVGNSTCGKSLAAEAKCTIPVSFAPTAAGAQTATLTVADNATPATQTVNLSGTASDFALSSADTTATVNAGQTATYTVTLSPASFTGAVAVTCGGAPTAATCAVNPASVNLTGSTAAQVTVTVATTAASGGLPDIPSNGQRTLWVPALAAILIGFLALSGVKGYRMKPSLVLMLVLLITCLGCGSTSKPSSGNGSNTPNNPTNPSNPTAPSTTGTAAGTSTITVTATSGSTARTLPLTLTVD